MHIHIYIYIYIYTYIVWGISAVSYEQGTPVVLMATIASSNMIFADPHLSPHACAGL